MTGRLAELVRAVDQADDDRRAVASVPEVLRQPGAAHEALAAEREAETDRAAGGCGLPTGPRRPPSRMPACTMFSILGTGNGEGGRLTVR